MLDHDDLKWITATVTDLNRRLQQITRLSEQAQEEQEESATLQRLGVESELAAKSSQALFDHVTARVLGNGSCPPDEERNFTVLPPTREVAKAPARSKRQHPVGELALVPKAEGSATVRNPDGKRQLILVVDDEPGVLEFAGSTLVQEDYRVLVAQDGFEALEIYRSMADKISLVILDFFLPVMDGEAIFDELQAIRPRVQVVLSSGFREQTKLGGMLARGLCGFIPKPYTGQKLLDQVRSMIAA